MTHQEQKQAEQKKRTSNFKAFGGWLCKTNLEIAGKSAEILCSPEFLQDHKGYLRTLYSIRTPEPTEEEISDWQEYNEKFQGIKSWDFDEIKEKYNVKFIRDENWEYDYWDIPEDLK